MKILLAGPGTGKTTKVKKIISEEYPKAEKINVLSFTNATVNDLTESFNQNPKVACSTLQSFALKLNPSLWRKYAAIALVLVGICALV